MYYLFSVFGNYLKRYVITKALLKHSLFITSDNTLLDFLPTTLATFLSLSLIWKYCSLLVLLLSLHSHCGESHTLSEL